VALDGMAWIIGGRTMTESVLWTDGVGRQADGLGRLVAWLVEALVGGPACRMADW